MLGVCTTELGKERVASLEPTFQNHTFECFGQLRVSGPHYSMTIEYHHNFDTINLEVKPL